MSSLNLLLVLPLYLLKAQRPTLLFLSDCVNAICGDSLDPTWTSLPSAVDASSPADCDLVVVQSIVRAPLSRRARVVVHLEHIALPAKLLDYFLRNNKGNINQVIRQVNGEVTVIFLQPRRLPKSGK